jgi:prefoldin subunit 4
LEEFKKTIGKEMKDIESKIKETTSTMSDLKTHLYGKFGNNINLEAED